MKTVVKKENIISKCYQNIDEMPVFNWNKCQKGEFNYLLKKPTKVLKKDESKLIEHWQVIFDQYLKEFGFGEKYLQLLELKRKVALMQIELMEIGRSPLLQNYIDSDLVKIEEKQKEINKGSDFFKTKALLEMNLKMQIDIRKTTVLEYYNYFKALKN